ncbi:dihydrolipoamide acetyltransferase family protein [Enteractinococcus coprophilus]|uniref:Dihydrolipoamide acetyltransferase component of pyruvate dehydrogenase complex n=1 Tax=Enteractinococcus coprophilus TaxID=1027633 RepID=A0A543AMR3_9MICC|nr:dihydrolipoamide acetyltransferase family protein [Enteractinococcus coprophilus]TQL73881.1 pyruvate dehydrogenase E2 component (dihydrolipoamide acetyltransferase) [Enteractinococcus coprophilus]
MKIFTLPDVGEGLTEADLVNWMVKVGDTVTVNQVVAEIETAKSLVEIPSPWAGVVKELFAEVGDTVNVGDQFFAIQITQNAAEDADGDDAPDQAPLVGSGPKEDTPGRRRRRGRAQVEALVGIETPVEQKPVEDAPVELEPAPAPVQKSDLFTKVLAKPPVRKLAKDHGLDLNAITATGQHGEVTRADVQAVLDGNGDKPAPVQKATAGSETIKVAGVRKATAKAVTESYTTAPHITVFREVDATRTMEYIQTLKKHPRYTDVRISPLLVLSMAVAQAALNTPEANATWHGDTYTLHRHVNLGLAAATPRGLLVPNIKNAHQLSQLEMADAIQELTQRARDGKTQPAELTGGTITITNIGVLGLDTGTPILNPGETGIVAFGAIKQKPWVVDGKIEVRSVTTLAAAFDHRIVDGVEAGAFLADVAAILEEPALLIS